MGAAIVRRDDLDVLALPPAIWLLVLNADVGEMDLVIEVRQVVFVCPFANLIRRAIRVAVVVVVVFIALMEPALVLALQLMVEDDAFDVRAAVQETVLGVFVRAIDLEVVFEFPFAPQARVERLGVLVIGVAVALESGARYVPVRSARDGLTVDARRARMCVETSATRPTESTLPPMTSGSRFATS